jgi:hypothetical protein
MRGERKRAHIRATNNGSDAIWFREEARTLAFRPPKGKMKESKDVFGITTAIRPEAYVDRGKLDQKLNRYLARNLHLALRGSSKSGKSWLRQRILPDAIVIQCRYGHTVVELYRLALNELGLTLAVTSTSTSTFSGTITAEGEAGISLLAKVRAKFDLSAGETDSVTSEPAVAAVNDLRVIANLINMSERRLVIEDFHYLSIAERKWLASDLKAFWEYGLYIVIIGIWSQNNMLLHFNPDLTGRLREVPISWADGELSDVLEKGSMDLNLTFSKEISARLVNDCYGNVGILQALTLELLDEVGLTTEQVEPAVVDAVDALDSACMEYSEQLVPVFLAFANNVAAGIRKRNNATSIFAHAMAAVIEQNDEALIKGVSIDALFEIANAREPRIQKGNLKSALANLESLQVDDGERGLVLAFNPTNSEITVVDRDLLFYRKYQTVSWPWEDLVSESNEKDNGLSVDTE